MRNLPLNDALWYGRNATVQVKTRYLKHGHRCDVKVDFPNLRCLLINGISLINNYDIFIDINTGELFKQRRAWIKQISLNQIQNAHLITLEEVKHIRDALSASFSNITDLNRKSIHYENAMNMILFEFYKNHDIDIKKLNDATLSEFRSYSRDFLTDIPKLEIRKISIETLISETTKNDNVVYFDEIINKFNARVEKAKQEFGEKINHQLEEKIDHIWIKYLLLRNDAKFSGVHKVSFFRYTGNEKKNTFDIMEIQINMMGSNHKENADFLKNNASKVNALLYEIVNGHSRSKKYTNYLKLYSLILTRENTLVARFCFKDGLEELCK